MKKILFFIAFLTLILIIPNNSQSQIISPSGEADEATTQLIFWYDELDTSGAIQITNTNDIIGTWVHVQIFRSYDPDGTPGNGDEVRCEERDFFDFYTPNDTHVYDTGSLVLNAGENGSVVPIDLTTPSTGTKGFIVITPVVSDTDATAKAFQHMIGNSHINSEKGIVNAMGRNAVDFATGEILSDGTLLDGTTNGFVVLQPEEFLLPFSGSSTSNVVIVGITFIDSYGPPGLLGYTVLPGQATWTPFIFDFQENPTSCGTSEVECFVNFGIDDENELDLTGLGDIQLCPGVSSPDNVNNTGDVEGWLRIFVSGLDPFESIISIFGNDETVVSGDESHYLFTR